MRQQNKKPAAEIQPPATATTADANTLSLAAPGQVADMTFRNLENEYRHPTYDEEMILFEHVKAGDTDWIRQNLGPLTSPRLGRLSKDPLRNVKYLFVAATTLTTRYALEGGLDTETAYTTSDLYIQKADLCSTEDAVEKLHLEMLLLFADAVARQRRKNVCSKPVLQCQDYICRHLNEDISLAMLAEQVHLNPCYLSLLFKKETGMTITGFLRSRRVEAAENMLMYSDASYPEISSYLSFCSQSYFIRIFREQTGYTPREFRNRFYHSSFERHHRLS